MSRGILPGMATDRSSRHREAETRIGWKMGGLGVEVSAHVLAGAILGWGYDKWQGTAPRGLTIGAIAGIVVGMWSLVRGALRLNRELERAAPTKGRGQPIPFDDDYEDERSPAGNGEPDRWDTEEKDDWQRN